MRMVFNEEVKALLQDAADWRLLSVLFERPGPGWRSRVGRLAAAVTKRELRAAAATAVEGTEGAWNAAFGPGGLVSAREAAHRPRRDPGHLLAEITSWYRAFAYRPSTAEPADHLAIEIGFVAYLRLKQAFAAADGNTEAAGMTAHAAADFIEQHLSLLASRLAIVLGPPRPFYLAVAIEALVQRTGPTPERFDDIHGRAEEDERLECGACPEAARCRAEG